MSGRDARANWRRRMDAIGALVAVRNDELDAQVWVQRGIPTAISKALAAETGVFRVAR